MRTSEHVQKLAAEALGTFILVTLGCGAAVASDGDIAAIGLAFGLALLVGVYAFGRVSGGHFNPAVTVGAAAGGRFPWRQVPGYVGAQVGGAIVAGLVLFITFQGIGVDGFTTSGHMGQNGYGDHSATHLAWWAAFVVELVLTAILVLVVLAVTDERNEHPALAPLAIGLALAAIHFVGIPLTGTSVNPARSIGPALFAGGTHIVQLWLFILAPLAGGVAAGVLHPLLFGRASEPVPGSGLQWSLATRRAPDTFQQQWNQPDATGIPGVTTPGTSTGTSTGTADADVATTRLQASSRDGGEAGHEHQIGAQAGHESHAVDPATAQPRIIQDGWEWDYVAQQWKPLQDPPEPGSPA